MAALIIEQIEGFMIVGTHEWMPKSEGWTRQLVEVFAARPSYKEGYNAGYDDGYDDSQNTDV